MKTLFIYLALVFWAGAIQAQEITELKEAKVGFAPLSSDVQRDGDSYTFNVHENYMGEFEKDPLAFLDNYFDINNFIEEVKDEGYDSYEVSLVSGNGYLKASYDRDGNLTKTSEKFKDVFLPEALRESLYRDHEGWKMVKNVHITTGRDGLVNRDFYRIKLKNDNRRMILKVDAADAEKGIVASN